MPTLATTSDSASGIGSLPLVVHSIASTVSPARPGKRTTGVNQVSWASGRQTDAAISTSSASSAKGMSSASTVTWKLEVALPPEFVAVTVTVACTALSVGMLTRPVLASIVAPAPLTAKREVLAGEVRPRRHGLDAAAEVDDHLVEPALGHRRRVGDRERRGHRSRRCRPRSSPSPGPRGPCRRRPRPACSSCPSRRRSRRRRGATPRSWPAPGRRSSCRPRPSPARRSGRCRRGPGRGRGAAARS